MAISQSACRRSERLCYAGTAEIVEPAKTREEIKKPRIESYLGIDDQVEAMKPKL